MELRLAFTEFLCAFCAVVLADRVYGFSDRLLGNLGLRNARQQSVRPAWQAQSDNDWYVHFHRNELTGTDVPTPRATAPAARPTPTPTRSAHRDTRPRLRAQ